MPFKSPRRSGRGYVLPKRAGGLSRTKSGKVRRFASARKARNWARVAMAYDHGFRARPR